LGVSVKQLFKGKAAAAVAFRPGVAPGFQADAARAIAAGRYLIFGGEEEGTATLLLSGAPRLVAVVRKEPDLPRKLPAFEVLSLREASADIDGEREMLSRL